MYNISMFHKILKYIFGFFLLGLILTAFSLSKTVLFLVSIFFIIIAMNEYRNMFKTKGIYPHVILPEFTGSLLAYLFIFYPYYIEKTPFILPLLFFSIILSFIFTVILNKKPYIETSMSTISAILFIFSGLYIIKLPYLTAPEASLKLLLTYFAAVLAGDYFASKIGPKYKKLLLAHEISPDKTVLGAFINLISACTVCLILKDIMPIGRCLLLGAVISIFSQFGDLTISTIKRELGLKHSGNLFCDYGGIFDRMDAFIFSAPMVYYFFIFT